MVEPGTEKDHPEIVAPPPLIFGGVLVVALALDWLENGPGFGLPYFALMIAGIGLTILGLILVLAAGAQFRREQTNVSPWKPSLVLITTGVYSLSRNPIYIGIAISYVGLSLLADSVIALVGLPIALAIIRFGVIEREEHYLEVRFGDAYRQYKARTRRWV